MIKIGGTEITDIAVGSTPIEKAYIGSTLVWEKSSPVPKYDAQVEFLQSSGTQYIQLPLSVTKDTYFEVGGEMIALHPSNSKYSIFSANPYQQCEAKFYSSASGVNTYDSFFGGVSTSGGWNMTVGEKETFMLSTTGLETSAGTNRTLSRPLKANITAFRIFGGYRNSNRFPTKFCSFYIKVGDTLVYDLIPVRKDGVGYMYDKISRELYGNVGSGSFTYGDDVII